MDSKTVNKLIRSDAWPILREQGFSHFDSRNAWAFRGDFIHVVNFQSFNSYHAGGLGCTTYSFALNLGTYTIGSPGGGQIERDKAGRLLPREYQCSFRDHLRKRTPVDGFKRDEIFFIHPDGRTTAACFAEVRSLLQDVAKNWFNAHDDLDSLIERMQRSEESSLDPDLHAVGNVGSLYWNQIKYGLLLLKHQRSPSQRSADIALESLDRMIGTILDFSTIQTDPPGHERHSIDVRQLWEMLEDFRRVPHWESDLESTDGCLDSGVWDVPQSQSLNQPIAPQQRATPSARKDLWPTLKKLGFSEFTDRLAHRVSEGFVEVVEFLPMDPAERKAWRLPSGLFRIGIGIYWDILRNAGPCRQGKDGRSRPKVNECHASNWLIPKSRLYNAAITAFDSEAKALMNLKKDGLEWLEIMRSAESALSLLERDNWEIFWRYPMMRAYGASLSTRRMVYKAVLNAHLGRIDAVEDCFNRAASGLDRFLYETERMKSQNWLNQLRSRLLQSN